MEAFLGQIRIFAGDYAPEGWALCDGRSMTIQGNEALYSLIGTTYGGNGQTAFNLPDLRGRLPLHIGQAPFSTTPTTNYALGQQVGAETVALTQAQLPAHQHSVMVSTQPATTKIPSGSVLPGKTSAGFYENTTQTVSLADESLDPNVGGNQAHNNMMPTLVLNYIICTMGLYPSQA